MTTYVHGYSEREAERLSDQANMLVDLLHADTCFGPGSLILECGCGTGAQTVHLARRNPKARIVAMDMSAQSLAAAENRINHLGLTNVTFQQGDIYHPAYETQSFDHVFVCFVLEHLAEPGKALSGLKPLLKPEGCLTVIEGDHGSWYCYPETEAARRTVQCLVQIQAGLKGDALIGRRLYPLLLSAGFSNVRVEPKIVYVDSSRPELVEGFSKNTFIAMVEGVEAQAILMGLIDQETWHQGIRDLYRATEADGTFCYTFFKATAVQ